MACTPIKYVTSSNSSTCYQSGYTTYDPNIQKLLGPAYTLRKNII